MISINRILPAILVQILLLLSPVQAQDSSTFFEQFKYCVALVEKVREGQAPAELEFIPHGTAFWAGDPGKGLYLVSNKHIFRGQKIVALRAYTSSDKESPVMMINLEDDKGKPLWIGHPDSLVDVAVIKVNTYGLLGSAQPKIVQVQTSLFATESEVIEGDDVFLLGFPLGLRTTVNCFPLLRSGAISLKPTRDFLVTASGDTVGKDIYLMDILSLGGNSGSPVFLKPGVNRPFLRPGVMDITKVKLIGIVSSHIAYFEPVVILQAVPYTRGNAGLAIIHPAQKILDVIRLVE